MTNLLMFFRIKFVDLYISPSGKFPVLIGKQCSGLVSINSFALWQRHAFTCWWPSDAIWRRSFWSTLVQIMAYCQPNTRLKQLNISEILCNSFQGNIHLNTQDSSQILRVKLTLLISQSHSTSDNELIAKVVYHPWNKIVHGNQEIDDI